MSLTLENIYVGMEIKNYKEFCKLLDEPIKSGKSKICQINRWKQSIDFERNATVGFKILKVGSVEDFHSRDYIFSAGIECFSLSYREAHKAGVYIIHNDTNAYIGSTRDFRERFLSHYRNPTKHQNNSYNILHNNGVFEVLWVAKDKDDLQELVNKEQYYLDYYKDINKYHIVNKNCRCATWQLYPERKYIISNIPSKYTNKKIYYKRCTKNRFKIQKEKIGKPTEPIKIKAKTTDIQKINELIILYDISYITATYVYFTERHSDKVVDPN